MNRGMKMFPAGASAEQPVRSPFDDSGSEQDSWLILIVLAIVSLGAVMVYSATIAMDKSTLDVNHQPLMSHLVHILIGVVAMFVASRMRLNWLQFASKKLLLAGLVLLGLVVVPGVGHEANGSTRWLVLGGVQFQPSELVKIAQH